MTKTPNPAQDLPSIDGGENEFSIAAAELRQFIERIERLEEERTTLNDDIKEVVAEAKGRGYDTKTIRAIVRLRKKDSNHRKEEEAMLELYKSALGME